MSKCDNRGHKVSFTSYSSSDVFLNMEYLERNSPLHRRSVGDLHGHDDPSKPSWKGFSLGRINQRAVFETVFHKRR